MMTSSLTRRRQLVTRVYIIMAFEMRSVFSNSWPQKSLFHSKYLSSKMDRDHGDHLHFVSFVSDRHARTIVLTLIEG
jgi:hypothetical protein